VVWISAKPSPSFERKYDIFCLNNGKKNQGHIPKFIVIAL